MAPRKKSLTSKLNEAAGNSIQTVETADNLSLMPFNQIKERASDTRQINQHHVKSLAMSIAAIGLIEPLVVDKDGILIAGGHRKAAIAFLENEPEGDKLLEKLFPGGIPIRSMPFSASEEPDKALSIEIAENEHRRDYTRDEIIGIAERLKNAGFEELKGRPKKGQKPLMPALTAIVGKSKRQVYRILEEPEKKSVTYDILSDSDRYLQRAIANLEKWEKSRGKKRRETNLSKEIPKLLDKLREGLGKE